MTYNVFGGTLNLALSIYLMVIIVWYIIDGDDDIFCKHLTLIVSVRRCQRCCVSVPVYVTISTCMSLLDMALWMKNN